MAEAPEHGSLGELVLLWAALIAAMVVSLVIVLGERWHRLKRRVSEALSG